MVSLRPTSELVVAAFLATLPGVPSGRVGATLPADVSSWAADGFVQVQVVGGAPDLDVLMRRPVAQVSCWAANPGASRKRATARAAALADTVLSALYGPTGHGHLGGLVTPLVGDYSPARVLTAYALTEPRNIDDADGLARFDFDVLVHWTLSG